MMPENKKKCFLDLLVVLFKKVKLLIIACYLRNSGRCMQESLWQSSNSSNGGTQTVGSISWLTSAQWSGKPMSQIFSLIEWNQYLFYFTPVLKEKIRLSQVYKGAHWDKKLWHPVMDASVIFCHHAHCHYHGQVTLTMEAARHKPW